MILLTRLKVLIRQKGILFWTFLFPLLLASMEFLAFGNLQNMTIDPISLSIVSEGENSISVDLKTIFEEAKLNDDESLFIINEISLEQAKMDFEAKKINIYLFQDDKPIVITRENSISTNVIKSILEKYDVVSKTITAAYEKYYAELNNGGSPAPVDPNKIIEELNIDFNYFEDNSTNKSGNVVTLYFYSLLAMTCMFAAYWGNGIISDTRADQSSLGIRINVSPTKKWKLLINYLLAAMILQFLGNILLLLFLRFILNIAFGNFFLMMLTMFIGSFGGMSLGMLVSLLVTGSAQKKESISTLITMLLSILAGLMSYQVKHIVDKALPLVKYINPANLVTESIYCLYYYDNLTNYFINISILFGISLLLLSLTIYKMRGVKYASI